MIARIWRGVTPESKASEYLEYMKNTGLKDYKSTDGNIAVYVLKRETEGKTEFILISFWESVEAIRRFAGAKIEKAVYYPKDREFLLELEPNVKHYEVATRL